MSAPELHTKRLLLRQWNEEDLPPFAAMNADPHVMEHFPAPLTEKMSDTLARRIMHGLQTKPFGLWAVEVNGTFIGFVGLDEPTFTAHFTPCIEIGWRLTYDAWGHGYAFESATRVLHYAQAGLKFEEVVSFTSKKNIRSIRLMKKLGMTRDPKEDFLHPKLPADHPLAPHVLYRKRLLEQ